jgi:hypothetical protein
MAHFIPSAGVHTKGSYNSTTTRPAKFDCDIRNRNSRREWFQDRHSERYASATHKGAADRTRLYASYLLSGRPCPVSSGAISELVLALARRRQKIA